MTYISGSIGTLTFECCIYKILGLMYGIDAQSYFPVNHFLPFIQKVLNIVYMNHKNLLTSIAYQH